MPDEDPTDHPRYFVRLDWSIKGRARTQTTTAKLFKILKENPTAERRFQKQALLLSDVSFSLWRGVFLYNRTGTLENRREHAKDFLRAMLEDNAITYARDKNSSEWTFNYYVNSARYRLEELRAIWPGIEGDGLMPEHRSSRNQWDHLQAAFERAVDRLEKEAENSN